MVGGMDVSFMIAFVGQVPLTQDRLVPRSFQGRVKAMGLVKLSLGLLLFSCGV